MTTASPQRTTALLSPAYRWATVGMVSLVFLSAFESLAVTTVMPTVAADLDGRSWFSVAFSATLAASVVGMVAGGLVADRRGPVPALLGSVSVFVVGLLLAGLAPGIELFVAARFLQGLGSGAVTVSLYVLVAQVYAAIDRPRIFGAFAAAWVLPSMIGPPVAGVVAETVGWRWVFLGVVVLSAAATAALGPALHEAAAPTGSVGQRSPGGGRRLALAVAVAGSVMTVDVAARASGPSARLLATAGILAALVAVRPLLPTGTLRARRGLPAVVLLRGLVAAAFFATEIHVPYLLQTRYDAPPWLAGLALTVGALGWAAASQVQARLGSRLSHTDALQVGSVLLAVALVGQLVVVLLGLPALLVPLVWVAAGAGMGVMYPRISSYVLGASAPEERGTHTAAMSISDAVGGATTIALAGLVFTTIGAETRGGFTGVFVLTAAVAVAAALVARRTPAR